MEQPTNGPWSIKDFKKLDKFIVIVGEGGDWLAKVDNDDRPEGQGEANAKLISAAQDLLSAARMAREELMMGGDWETAKDKLTSAINKATK